MAYYAVAYGHVIRTEKASVWGEACKLAFGMVDARRMTVEKLPKNPRYMSHKGRVEEFRKLAIRHFRKTGSYVSGFEKEPEIADVHWTACPLCKRPVLTEPKSAGEDDKICSECEPRYLAIEDRDKLSIAETRRRLGIEVKF